MRDGSVAVLFASCSTPAVGLEMVLKTWREDGAEPVEVRVYRGGNTKAIGQPLATWRA